jgi:hypothetical protein
MGAFYGSVHVRVEDRTILLGVLDGIARAGRTRFLVSPSRAGWTSIFPSEGGQDFAVSAAVAARVTGPILHLVLHDDDVFAYRLYGAGRLIDEYDSNPDYFQEASRGRWNETAGRPDALAALGGKGEVAEFARLLSREKHDADPFRARQQLEGLAARLGLRDVETSYEYLQEGEAEGIKGRKRFVHVPDLTAEKDAKRRQRGEVTAAVKQLQKTGSLLLAKKPPPGNRTFPRRPIFCASVEGGFWLVWSDAQVRSEIALERWGPPWREASDSGLRIRSTAYRMSASPDGRYLAVGHASGDWNADLFDLAQRRRVTTVPLPRAVSHVSFTADGGHLICRSEGELRVVATGEGHSARALKIGQGEGAEAHPDGHWLLAGVRAGRTAGVALIDLVEWRVDRVLATARNQYDAWMADVAPARAVTAFHPSETAKAFEFTPDGRVLVIRVDDGVRAYEWKDVAAAEKALPPPFATARAEVVQVETSRFRNAYDSAWDARRNRVVFAALDGHVHELDIASGRTARILEMPGTPPLVDMALTSDGTALAVLADPGMFDQSDRRPPSIWTLWNLDLLESRRLRAVR